MNVTKSIIYIFALSLICLTSCEKFLDREPLSQVTQEDFFNSETNANSSVIGMYRTMMNSFSYGQSMVIVPEFSANHVSHSGAYPEFENFAEHNVTANNAWIANMWQASYATINAANNIIERVPEMDETQISEPSRNRFIGEAKFVRALNYFFLVRAFGNIPLKLTATKEDEVLDIPQSTPEEVFAQIIKDLTEAAENLAEIEEPEVGRASAWAAKALLAKVYLYDAARTNDYAKVVSLTEEVIKSGNFSLVANYASIWKDENTAESIFELQFDDQATNTLAAVGNDNASMLFYGKGSVVFNLFNAKDNRRDATVKLGVRDEFNNGNTYYTMGKFPNAAPASQNLPIIRLAELYLIHAEAKARVDNSVSAASYASLKAVQDRAGVTKPIGTYKSLDAYITAIQEEKRLELAFEGETWFDFCRTKLALKKFSTLTDENHFFYPIPTVQEGMSQYLEQNPGY